MTSVDQIKVVTTARLWVREQRVEEVLERLVEWVAEEGMNASVVRAGKEEVVVTERSHARDLPQGTMSSAAWLSTRIERAYQELFEWRWFGRVRVESMILETKDEKQTSDDSSVDAAGATWTTTDPSTSDEASPARSLSEQVAAEETAWSDEHPRRQEEF
jgi:hypothetical protein